MTAQKTASKIIINKKEYTRPQKMDTMAYLDYLDVRERINAIDEKENSMYKRKDFEDMVECIVHSFGDQFTAADVMGKDGLSPADIMAQFIFIELAQAEEVNKRAEKLQKNFSGSK